MKLAKQAVEYYTLVTGNDWNEFYNKLDMAMMEENPTGELFIIKQLMECIIRGGTSLNEFKVNKDMIKSVFDEDGIPVAGDLGDNAFTGPDGQVYTQLRNLVFYNGDVELISRYPTYICEVSGKEMSALKALREMQGMKWTNAVGSSTLPTPSADVQRFYDQSLAEFLSGAKALTPENWAAFIDQFNKIGGEAWNASGIEAMEADGLVRE